MHNFVGSGPQTVTFFLKWPVGKK